ncbi:MAG: hypothetical protein IPG28_17850 [Betaproteobacteria bacterium]|nr:hypothetical protein [Betaproteobacteria bacterium]
MIQSWTSWRSARYTAHFKEIEQYFKAAYLMKKLEEFAGSYLTSEQRKERGRTYVDLLLKGFRNHPDRDGYFARDITGIRENGFDEETDQFNPEVEQIIDICNQRGSTSFKRLRETLPLPGTGRCANSTASSSRGSAELISTAASWPVGGGRAGSSF